MFELDGNVLGSSQLAKQESADASRTKKIRPPRRRLHARRNDAGDSVILVGLVAVAQLVPVSVLLNSANRMDSTSLVIAQRQMDLLLQQPLASTSYTDVTGLACSPGDTCNLGDPTQPNVVVGSPVV